MALVLFGPSTSTPSPAFLYLWAVLIILFIVLRFMLNRKRRQSMAALAARTGLTAQPDNELPGDLSLDNTPFQRWWKLQNIYSGSVQGEPLVLLDFSQRAGRSVWTRTIIAVRSHREVFPPDAIGLESSAVGEWQLLYAPVKFFRTGKLLPVSQIEAMLLGISVRSSVALDATQATEGSASRFV